MGKFPCLKLSFIFYPLLSLFLLPIISCSTLDLSTIISDLKYDQTSSEIGEELGSIDEKQKKILRKKDKEIILLQERIYQLTKLKKTIEKKKPTSEPWSPDKILYPGGTFFFDFFQARCGHPGSTRVLPLRLSVTQFLLLFDLLEYCNPIPGNSVSSIQLPIHVNVPLTYTFHD